MVWDSLTNAMPEQSEQPLCGEGLGVSLNCVEGAHMENAGLLGSGSAITLL